MIGLNNATLIFVRPTQRQGFLPPIDALLTILPPCKLLCQTPDPPGHLPSLFSRGDVVELQLDFGFPSWCPHLLRQWLCLELGGNTRQPHHHYLYGSMRVLMVVIGYRTGVVGAVTANVGLMRGYLPAVPHKSDQIPLSPIIRINLLSLKRKTTVTHSSKPRKAKHNFIEI